MRSMRTIFGAIWTKRQIPKTFCVCSSSFIPGRSGSLANVELLVLAIDVGIGKGDSSMDTAAAAGVDDETAEAPLTMTCRSVDLSAANNCDGGAVTKFEHLIDIACGAAHFCR